MMKGLRRPTRSESAPVKGWSSEFTNPKTEIRIPERNDSETEITGDASWAT